MRMARQHWFGWLTDSGIVSVVTFLAYIAHSNERPITAVLLHLLGVLLVSAHSGQFRGVLSAIVSFLAYLFLVHPANSFAAPTGDNLVPLIAFLSFAIAASALVGRLRDRTAAAILAKEKSAFLLEISEAMQRVLRVEDIDREVQRLLPSGGVLAFKTFIAEGGDLVRPWRFDAVTRPDEESAGEVSHEADGHRQFFFELHRATERLGLIEITVVGDELTESDLRPIAALLTLTVDRCFLLDRISEVQAAERTEKLKDAILSSVSHDLRTPLTAIDAASSALHSPDLQISDRERAELLASIREQCARLNRYTGDLLDMGRIQSGISRDAFEAVELSEILTVAYQQVRDDYPEVSFQRSLPAEQLLVRANALMLQQALFNLMDNAAKHAGQSASVKVTIEAVEGHALIKIDDNGPGIPPSEHVRIFERFYSINGVGDKGGSGLGLYIAKGFVEAFGGSITVESPLAYSHGTRMQVCLPAKSIIFPNEFEHIE